MDISGKILYDMVIKQDISLEIIKNISYSSYLFITFLNFFALKLNLQFQKQELRKCETGRVRGHFECLAV